MSSGAVLAKKVDFNNTMVLSKQLQQFTGEETMTLAELIIRLHRHITENNLYVQGNKKKFVRDKTLEKMLGTSGTHLIANLTRLILPQLQSTSATNAEHDQYSEQVQTRRPERKEVFNSKQSRQRNEPRSRNLRNSQQEPTLSHHRMAGFEAPDTPPSVLYTREERSDTVSAARIKPRSKSKRSEPRTKNGLVVVKKTGLNTAMVLSKRMQKFAGADMMTRAELFRRILLYIRDNNLYVQNDKNRFTCDRTLEMLLGTVGIQNRSQIMRLMGPHLMNPTVMGAEYEKRSRKMFEEELKQRGAMNRRELRFIKDPRGRNSPKKIELREKGVGLYAEVDIAPSLRPLCEGRKRMSRPQVLKAVWNYIKTHNLQHPNKRRYIIVSDVLRKALQVGVDREWIDSFEVTGYVCKLLTSRKMSNGSTASGKRRLT